MRTLVTLSIILVVVGGSGVFAQTTIYQQNFDGSNPGWTYTNGSANVGWANDGAPATVGASGGNAYASSPSSLNYNNGTDFDDAGNANGGKASSMLIDATGYTSLKLVFSCNYETETTASTYDKRYARILDENGNSLNQWQVFTTASGGAKCDVMGTWHTHTLSIAPGTTKLKIEFEFDTVDGIANNYAGWFIDDVKVTGSQSTGGGGTPVDVYTTAFDQTTETSQWTGLGVGLAGAPAWNADADPATVGASGPSSFNSSPNSLNFNNETDFNDPSGSAVSGSVQGPLIDLTGKTDPIIKFQCAYETETDGTTYDQRFVDVLDENDNVLITYQFATTGASTSEETCAAMGTWHLHTIYGDPAWTKIKLQFRFDSLDGIANNYAGWFIDDLKVSATSTTGGGGGGGGGGGTGGGGGGTTTSSGGGNGDTKHKSQFYPISVNSPKCYTSTVAFGANSDITLGMVSIRDSALTSNSISSSFTSAYTKAGYVPAKVNEDVLRPVIGVVTGLTGFVYAAFAAVIALAICLLAKRLA